MSVTITNLFNEVETKRKYTYSDITELLSQLECPVNKFLPEVKKILKLKASSPLWYGFSEVLIAQYNQLKNKDQYASIKGEYNTSSKGQHYNFRCCPISRSYYVYHCLKIEINNGIVKVIEAFEESV